MSTCMSNNRTFGVSAGKRDQIDKKIFFEITSDLDQMTKFTSILLRNFFFKKKLIWSLFPALTPYYHITADHFADHLLIIYSILSHEKNH